MKAKKYLKGGQVKLDANKDGKISGADFSMLRKGLKKYQSGGKAPEGQSKEERMYLEIRKDAERMEKEMKRQGMSQAEINKKLDAYMEKAMSQAQYSKKKSYQDGGKAPKGEIDLGSTVASKYRLSLKDAEEMTDRVEKNYGRHASDIKTGYKGIDRRLEEAERNERQARARAGNTYYDGDGGGAARREKAYADRLGRRILAKMSAEKMDAYREKSKANEMKKGGKIVKYQGGGKSEAAMGEREQRLAEIKENSQQMSKERALMQRIGFAQKRAKTLGKSDWSQGFTQEEMDLFRQIQERGMTQDIKKTR